MTSLSFRRRSRFLLLLLSLLLSSLIIKEVVEAGEAERRGLRQRWEIHDPRASKCRVSEDDENDDDNVNHDDDDTTMRCSLTSKIRLDYTIHKDSNVSYRIFQKGCKEDFIRGTEPFKMGAMLLSPSTGTASIELFTPNNMNIPLSSPPVEFCIRMGLQMSIEQGGRSTEVNFRETNVAVDFYYRAKKNKTKMMGEEEDMGNFFENKNNSSSDNASTTSTSSVVRAPQRNSAVYLVVDKVTIESIAPIGAEINTKVGSLPRPAVEENSLSPTSTSTSTTMGQQREVSANNRIHKGDEL